MASGNKPEIDTGGQKWRLEINTNIGKPEGLHSTRLNTRRLMNRVMPVSLPMEPPRFSLVPLDKLIDDKVSGLGFMLHQ